MKIAERSLILGIVRSRSRSQCDFEMFLYIQQYKLSSPTSQPWHWIGIVGRPTDSIVPKNVKIGISYYKLVSISILSGKCTLKYKVYTKVDFALLSPELGKTL